LFLLRSPITLSSMHASRGGRLSRSTSCSTLQRAAAATLRQLKQGGGLPTRAQAWTAAARANYLIDLIGLRLVEPRLDGPAPRRGGKRGTPPISETGEREWTGNGILPFVLYLKEYFDFPPFTAGVAVGPDGVLNLAASGGPAGGLERLCSLETPGFAEVHRGGSPRCYFLAGGCQLSKGS
jgi:hypothetical protein